MPQSHARLFSATLTPFLLAVCLLGFAVPSAEAGPVSVEDVAVEPSGGWRLDLGADWESSRDLGTIQGQDQLEYNNLRLSPVDVKYGLMRNLELGLGLGYSSNSASDSIPDEGGFEGLTFTTKYRWTRNIATTLDLGFGGSDEIVPYTADGFNVGLNIPVKYAYGPGAFHGELGFTVQSGDLTGITGQALDRENYLNYGVGYVYDVNRWWSLSGELVGHGETVQSGESHLEIVLGSPYRLGPTSLLAPDLTFGLSDGSPSFALGLNYSIAWGRRGQRRSMQTDQGTTPQQQARAETDREQPLITPEEPETSAEQQQQSAEQQQQSDRDPERARQLAQEAQQAYRQGNKREARQKFRQAVRLDPQNADVQFNLATLHFQAENYQKARDHYRNVVDMNPRDATAHYYLGLSHEQIGNTSQARKQYRRVLELDPGHEKAQQRLDNL